MAESKVNGGQEVHRTMGELVRFGIIGVAHNLLGYLVYLLITWAGVGPKIAIAILYPVGTAISYFANRGWTFKHQGKVPQSMGKFLLMHVCGYLLNIIIMYLGHDVLLFPHQLVQLFAMGFLAMVFFVVSKYVVFADSQRAGSA